MDAAQIDSRLRGLHEATIECCGRAPTLWRRPPDLRALDSTDLIIPEDVRSLYTVTDGLRAFSFYIWPLSKLSELNSEADEFMGDYDIDPDLDGMLWGPKPTGEVLTISAAHGAYLFVETTGPRVGGLTFFDAAGDSGYRWVGPSLEAVLDAWVLIAEAGLVMLIDIPNGEAEVKVDNSDESVRRRVAELLADHPCTPACAWILEPGPEAE